MLWLTKYTYKECHTSDMQSIIIMATLVNNHFSADWRATAT